MSNANLNRSAKVDADIAYLDRQREGGTQAECVEAAIAAYVSATTPGGAFITESDGSLHLVDYAGVRLLSQGRDDSWDIATTAANWPAWREFAQIVLAMPDPDSEDVAPTPKED